MTHPLPPAYRRISQAFGVNPSYYAKWGLGGHEGLDFSCPEGTPVCALRGGKVSIFWAPYSYGHYVVVAGADMDIYYAHLSRMLHDGETVSEGTIIGYSGNSGNSTGPHLHIGIRPKPVDWNNGFQGFVDPTPSLQEQHMTKLAGHVQVLDDAVIAHLRQALYPAIKALTGVDPTVIRDKVLSAYEGRPRPFIWPRKWTDDIAADCVRQGAAGAKRFRDAVIGEYARWRDVLGCQVVELDNEIICWSDDDAKRHNAFEAELIRLLAQDGFGSIALNTSVGWLKIEHWQHYKETLATAQYIGPHEYGWPATNAEGQNLLYFDWHVLRYRKACEEIRRLGYRLPRLLITELGWEGALINLGHRGFRMFADQTPYLDWLKWYDAQIAGDPPVEYAAIFETGAQAVWKEMDAVGSRIDAPLADYVRNSYATGSAPDAEVTQLKAMLATHPATQKACLERGYIFLREAYDLRDTHARALAYDPARKKYIGLWLDSKTWKVIREEVLSDPVTL